jgi:uncharacterized protein (TIGR02271 family)
MASERTTQYNDKAISNQRTTIPVIEEKIRIDREVVDTGTVYVRKEVGEKQVNIETTLAQDDIHIERTIIDKPIESAPPAVRYEGDTMIVSVVQEELVIQKRLILVEEIRITKNKVLNERTHPVNIRKEEVFIDTAKTDATNRRRENDVERE